MPLAWETTRQPMRTSSLRSLPPPDVSSAILPSQQTAIVSLSQVRCGPRAINEYVESPRPLPILPLKSSPIGLIPSSLPPSPAPTAERHIIGLPCRSNRTITHTGGTTNISGSGGNNTGGSNINSGNGQGGVVSSQPTKIPLPPLKDDGGVGAGDGHSSIICAKCGKCRCAACSEPREFPSRWCCGDRYEVSARKVLDVCSCFCCVQTAFYHCGAEEDNTCYDDPCACGGNKCCSRWTCLAASALLLPCLWCYWPMRGCLAGATACYNCCRKKGCQCTRQRQEKTFSACSQTRRLLIESDSSSA